MGQRIKENWNKYKDLEANITEENFLDLENLKKLFLSQRFITTFLRSLQIFEKWTLKSLEKLLYVAEMRTLPKDEDIFTQGEDAEGFYIVFKGDVLVTYTIRKSYYERLAFDKNALNSVENKEEEDKEQYPLGNNVYK